MTRLVRKLTALSVLGLALVLPSTATASNDTRVYVVAVPPETGPGALGLVPEAVDPTSKAITDPGDPFGITASGVPGGPKVLLTQADGTVSLGNADGSGTPQAISQRSSDPQTFVPDMSLDASSQTIAYVAANGDIHVASLVNGGDRDLNVAGTSPEISPDGHWVAFVDTNRNLDLITTDGAGFKQLVAANKLGGMTSSWFPDSQRLVTIVGGVGCDGGPDVASIDTASARATGLNVAVCPGTATSPKFLPQQVAVSPDGSQLAVSGQFSQCNPAPGFESNPPCAGGELGGDGMFFQEQLGVVPATGGPFGNVIQRMPGGCIDPAEVSCLDPTGAPLEPANSRGSDYFARSLSWGPITSVYKLIFYANATGLWGHSFVQFRTTEGPPATTPSPCTGWTTCLTMGKYPGTCGVQPTFTGFFNGPGCLYTFDGMGPWTHRIVYTVTKQQYNDALAYANSQAQAGAQHTLNYAVLANNCMAFDEDVAQAAGITLPPAFAVGFDGVAGGLIADPKTFDRGLAAAGDGASIDGGIAQATDGSTANGAPDPPPPPEPGSATSLIEGALGDPATEASTFDLQHDTLQLSSVELAPGGQLQLSEHGTLPANAIYGVDWGDGTNPDLAVVDPDSAADFVPQFTHTYANAGTYAERLIVIDGALEEYDATVTVQNGGAASLSQFFDVAAAPAQWNFSGQTFGIPAVVVALAGAPGAPRGVAATAGAAAATVSFAPPADGGDSAITEYTVAATDTTTPANGGQTATGSGSPVTVGGLTNGDAYTFTLTGSNAEGPGLASDPSNSVVPTVASPAGPPSGGSSPGPPSGGGQKTLSANAAAGHPKTSGPAVTVPLSCQGPSGTSCVLMISLTVTETLKGKKLIAVGARARRTTTTHKLVVVGRTTTTIAAGKSLTVALKLSAAGQRLLKRYGHLPATLKVTQAGVTRQIAGQRIRFTSPERRHKGARFA